VSNPPYGEAIEHDAGQGFNYAVWSAGSHVSLHNVRWNSDYRDIVYFDTQQKLDDYLATVTGPQFTTVSYCKANEPVKLDLPFNACYMYNYLRVYNPAQPITNDVPRTFYYFITNVVYLSPNTTQLTLQLDVWQTFSRFITFGKCYIERGHIGIANKNQFADHGREYLTVPEGFDVGNEYVISAAYEYTLAKKDTASVLVASTTDLNIDPGTVDSPNLLSASGSTFEGLPNGMAMYLFQDVQDFRTAMVQMVNTPWMTQGIMSITLLPGDFWNNFTNNTTVGTVTCRDVSSDPGPISKRITLDDPREKFGIPERYSRLEKFKVFPYAAIEITTYNSAPLLLKPECIATDLLYTQIAYHLAPPNPRIVIYPLKYNGRQYQSDAEALADMKNDEGFSAVNDRSEFLDFTTGIHDFPMFSLVNNGYLSYMAANANRIAYAYQNAEWTQQRAMAGVQLGYNQATMAANTALWQSGNQQNLAFQQTDYMNNNRMAQAALGGMRNFIGGFNGIGGVGGAVVQAGSGLADMGMGLASAGMDSATQMAITGAQAANMAQNASLAYNNSLYARDTNREYGNFAAHGDYANEIAGINARVQDAKLIQPTTSGQMGGEAFNIAAFKWGIFTKFKTLQPAVMATIGEYWLRYGYAINRFGQMPPTFGVMTKFTYWKLRETYITSAACPEGFKQAIRGIFEKGVTVWTNPNEMGSIDMADNEPLTGVTL